MVAKFVGLGVKEGYENGLFQKNYSFTWLCVSKYYYVKFYTFFEPATQIHKHILEDGIIFASFSQKSESGHYDK